MTLATYDPKLFDTLPSFEMAQESLRRFEGWMPTLGKIVSGHGGDGRVGLSLLHRHFDLREHEILVERLSDDRRASVGQPRSRTGAGPMMPHTFRAVRNGASHEWYPVEFADLSEEPAMAASYRWLASQGALLNGLASTLGSNDALDVFGLSLAHGREEIACDDDEVLVEETDEETRTLTLRPRPLRALRGQTTPTNWSVSEGTVVLRCTCQRDQSGSHQHFETN